MADSKITALTSIGASTDPANDPLVLVDVSDTSMAATGTTKKVTLNQLLGASGTATLASATITGDLTVDTSTLKVDSANNRVGIGTASPAAPLDIQGGTNRLQVQSSSNGAYATWRFIGKTSAGAAVSFEHGVNIAADNAFELYDTQNSQLVTRYVNTGTHSWFLSGSTAMTLNSTGLGVGVTPSAGRGAIQLSAGVGFPATQVASSDANTLDDYEEGTFTPTITGTGLTGITYTTQSGVYTKVGRMVTFAIQIAVSVSTRAAAIFQIGSLPFTASGSNAYGALISYTDSGFFATAGANKPNLLVSSTDVVFYKSDGTAFNGTDIAANAFNLRITGTYFTT